MSRISFGRNLRAVVGLCTALIASVAGAQATQGTINVRVTDAAGGQPVEQAQVMIVGTTLGGLTNAEGSFCCAAFLRERIRSA
jgi:hypothetical protein